MYFTLFFAFCNFMYARSSHCVCLCCICLESSSVVMPATGDEGQKEREKDKNIEEHLLTSILSNECYVINLFSLSLCTEARELEDREKERETERERERGKETSEQVSSLNNRSILQFVWLYVFRAIQTITERTGHKVQLSRRRKEGEEEKKATMI